MNIFAGDDVFQMPRNQPASGRCENITDKKKIGQ